MDFAHSEIFQFKHSKELDHYSLGIQHSVVSIRGISIREFGKRGLNSIWKHQPKLIPIAV